MADAGVRFASSKCRSRSSRHGSLAVVLSFTIELAFSGAAPTATSRNHPQSKPGNAVTTPVSVPPAGKATGLAKASARGAIYPMRALAGGATPQPLSRQYIQTRWTEQEGLPQNSVNAILQTRDGYLWVGTFGGLARFDGVKFTVFNSANTPGMTANRILSLYEDRAGVLWIGTENGEVMSLKDGKARTFTSSDGLPGGLVWCFCESQDGVLWVGSTKGLTRWQQGQVRTYTKQDGLAGDKVWSIYEDRPGHFWLGTDEGLTEFSDGRGVGRNPGDALRVIIPGPEDSMWLGGARFARVVGGNLTDYPLAKGLSNQFIRAMTIDHSGNIWGGLFDSGVVCRWDQRNLSEGSSSSPSPPQTIVLGAGGIRSIYVDTEGNLWVGATGDGLVRIKERTVTAYGTEEGLPDEGIQAVTDDGGDGVWATTGRGLIHVEGILAPQLTTYMESSPLEAVYRDRDGTIWTGGGGLTRFHNGEVTTYSASQGLSHGEVHAIAEDNDGNLWAGTASGLNEFRDGKFVVYHNSEGLPTDDIRFIMRAKDGSLWLGTVGGLSHFRNGVFTNYTTEQGLSNNYVRSILEDDDGTLWIGTYGGGLDRFKDGRFVHFTMKDGLFDPFISQIIDDGKGRLWMLSNHGVFHIACQELKDFADGRASSITCVSYGVADGMKSSEGNGGSQPAGCKAPDGKLWFATIKGLVTIDPTKGQAILPPIVIEDVLLDREELPAGKPVRVPPGKDSLEIHYTGLSFSRPDQIRFKYRLIGLDKEWIDARTRRVAYYSHIPPGQYTFSVMAASIDGVWNPSAATLSVVVVPPFWRTWWFLSLVLASAAGLLATVYWRRVEYLKRARAAQEAFSRKLLESQEKERQRIAAELHDGLGQSLLIIKNRAYIASSVLDNREGTKEQLEEITDSASRAIEEVREIAFNLRPYQLNRFGLTRTLQAIFTRFSDPGGTVFSAQIDPIDGLFTKDDEISIYRIVQEGINNIVKHSSATEATLTVKRDGRDVEFVIHDNGRGFDPAFVASSDGSRPGFGLTGMAERVRMLGGAYMVQSAPGQGTAVTIKLNTADTKHEN